MMKSTRHSSLIAGAMIAALGAGLGVQVPSLRTVGAGNNRRPTLPRRDTALAREIADHNEAVERRKAERRARKLTR